MLRDLLNGIPIFLQGDFDPRQPLFNRLEAAINGLELAIDTVDLSGEEPTS